MTHQRTGLTDAVALLPEEAMPVPDGAVQLSKLSSVLNGLEGGAQLMQRHIQDAVRAIAAGTYRVDPVQLSKRIVGEALRTV
jgi:hypothetical protein